MSLYCSGITRKLSEYNFKVVCTSELPSERWALGECQTEAVRLWEGASFRLCPRSTSFTWIQHSTCQVENSNTYSWRCLGPLVIFAPLKNTRLIGFVCTEPVDMSIMAIKRLTSTDLIDIKSFFHSIIIKNISKNLLSQIK